jgi:hypothetical protein
MSTFSHSFSRPTVSRQRSNSVPVFGLVNVSAAEASVLFSAAERATARRRRPASVDSPGPSVSYNYDVRSIQTKVFNFSTPSRCGFGSSPLRNPVPSIASEHSTPSEDEITPTNDDSKPLPPLPQDREVESPALNFMDQEPIVAVRPPSGASLFSSPPLSPRRQVPNQTLKAYADGLFLFTQSRLQTAAPENLKSLGLTLDMDYDGSAPPTPELEEEDVRELSPRRPELRSQFSDWSGTTTDNEDDYDGYLSSAPPSPHTPDMEIGLLSPDSFFNAEVTPRVVQRTQWATLSSARPSSGIEAASQSLRSSDTHATTSSTSTSDSFSYFAGFDSVTNAVETGFSSNDSPLELLQSPYRTPPRTQPPRQNSFLSHSEPTSSVSNLTPFYRVEGLAPGMDEMNGVSRPPSWLVRAIC